MELRYRRRIKMPIWNLPGFSDGLNQNPFNENVIWDLSNNLFFNRQSNNIDAAYYGYWDGDPGPDNSYMPTTDSSLAYGLGRHAFLNRPTGGTPSLLKQILQVKPVKINPVAITNNENVDTTTDTGGLRNVSGEQWNKIGQSAIQFTGATMNSFSPVKTDSELYADAGQTVGHGAGFDYIKQNDINEHAEYQDLKAENTRNTLATTSAGIGLGAAVGTGIGMASGVAAGAAAGSAAGPIGAAAGLLVGLGVGLWGSKNRKHKLKDRMYNAQQNIIRENTYARASGESDYLTQNYYNNYGTTQGSQLYSAKYGKDSGVPLSSNNRRTKIIEFNRRLSLPNIKEQ